MNKEVTVILNQADKRSLSSFGEASLAKPNL